MTAPVLETAHLPRYKDIPDIGLLLEQTVRLVNGYVEPLGVSGLTSSMVSNYVKHDIIDRPRRKQYGRDQLAYLTFIAVAKMVLPLDDIQVILEKQRERCSVELAYDCFCEELECALAGKVCELQADDAKIAQLQELAHDIAAAASVSIALRVKLERLTK